MRSKLGKLTKLTPSAVGILAILVVVFLVLMPYIRNLFAPMFPEGFRNVDCKGVTCGEGEFCMDNVCHPVSAPVTSSCGQDTPVTVPPSILSSMPTNRVSSNGSVGL